MRQFQAALAFAVIVSFTPIASAEVLDKIDPPWHWGKIGAFLLTALYFGLQATVTRLSTRIFTLLGALVLATFCIVAHPLFSLDVGPALRAELSPTQYVTWIVALVFLSLLPFIAAASVMIWQWRKRRRKEQTYP